MDIAAIQALGTQKERKQSQVSGGTIPRGQAGDGAAVHGPWMEDRHCSAGLGLVTHSTALWHPGVIIVSIATGHRTPSLTPLPCNLPPRMARAHRAQHHDTDRADLGAALESSLHRIFIFWQIQHVHLFFRGLSPGYFNWKCCVCKLKKLLSDILDSKMPKCSLFLLFLFFFLVF